jgi:hypothetical protein
MPQLVLDDRAHRAWFDALMEDMGGSAAHGQARAKQPQPVDAGKAPAAAPAHADDGDDADAAMPSADRIYTVQVVWDETMADTAARWLAGHPGGHVILLAGNGHCHDSAIVNRMKRRGIADALSVRGVIDDGEGAVGEALARPINDFLFVLQMPPDVQRAEPSDGGDAKAR